MSERSNASYHPATFLAPNLRDIKSSTFPLNYNTGEPAPIVKKARDRQRPGDDANKKKVPKTSEAVPHKSSRNGNGIDRIDHAYQNTDTGKSYANTHISSQKGNIDTTSKPAKRAKADKKGGDSTANENRSRIRGALSGFKSKVTKR